MNKRVFVGAILACVLSATAARGQEPAAANPEPPKPAPREAPTAAAKPGKDCKIEFAGISVTFPCPE